MRLHRFFITDGLAGKKQLAIFDADVIHQWKNVFRLKAGDKVILLDNSGFEFLSEITMLAKEKAEVSVLEEKEVEAKPKKEIWLYAALIKKDNYEWILEKCTELGVSHFVPIISERSEKKNLNLERARKIIKESSEQSGRGTLPILEEPVDLETALGGSASKLIAFHVEGKHFDSSLRDSLSAINNPAGLLIGPEGGWSDKEIELFKAKNIPIYSVGNTVLRAETAAIVIPALILL